MQILLHLLVGEDGIARVLFDEAQKAVTTVNLFLRRDLPGGGTRFGDPLMNKHQVMVCRNCRIIKAVQKVAQTGSISD